MYERFDGRPDVLCSYLRSLCGVFSMMENITLLILLIAGCFFVLGIVVVAVLAIMAVKDER